MSGKKIIAHAGSHSTGKTEAVYSHAAFLKKTKPNLKIGIVNELARECPFPIHDNQNIDSVFWLLTSQIKAELEAATKYDIVICDRSVFDCIAYTHVASPQINTKTIIRMASLHHFRHYHPIIYHSVCNNKICSDGFRNEDSVFRSRVDYALKALFHIYSIRFVPVENTQFTNPWWDAVLEANASSWSPLP